jgi:hypothetical protein
LLRRYALTVEQEANRMRLYALPFGVRIHKLSKRSIFLYLEVNLVAVLRSGEIEWQMWFVTVARK